MSTYADPSKAYVWLDGDVYRAPAGAAQPEDPFANVVMTDALTWDAYGGIEAGFEVTPKRDLKTLPVWNRRTAPYKVVKGPQEDRFKLRAVDYSQATVLTALQGGSITQIGATDVYAWEPGDDEEFALICLVRDDDKTAGFYCPRVTLATPPPRMFGGETLDGFEFELLALEPVITLTSWNPVA
ncbi:hypothetical protein [Rhodococcus marinonascens]|uniref:hypothetical protein n=1 Tax=Rhodococcus marinonascens TaxID=38311 RepID=UPI000933F1B4|nr:hypothetical protein [Rhodococcus marinonascens]